ncbi:MAG TPA: hypothetical protein VGC56_14920 [Allosphingosinicella sp.]|jgi:hypothetical protein
MPIIEFENYHEVPLVLVIEPWGHRHEVPERARVGVRYALAEGAEDRCYSAVSAQKIELWCEAASYEIDIVPPLPAQRLMRDICVRGGWCGGMVEGVATHVLDLLPASGRVTAEDFANLAIKADGDQTEPPKQHHLRWLEAKFAEHLGTASVDAELLHRTARRPFDSEPC